MTRLKIGEVALLILSAMTSLIISSNSYSYASQSGIEFYSPNSLPGGLKFEDILSKWWIYWSAFPPSYLANWPQCVKGEVTIGHNQSLTFLGDLAGASQMNLNATHQNCQISHNTKLYLSVYDGECSTAEYPGESAPQLLKCAQGTNQVIKLMKVIVNGRDVSSNITRESSSNLYHVTFNPGNLFSLKPPEIGTFPAMGESYYLLFHPLPIGSYTIQVEVIRDDIPSGSVEHDLAHWDIKVVP
jgi:hypothetical protein